MTARGRAEPVVVGLSAATFGRSTVLLGGHSNGCFTQVTDLPPTIMFVA